MRSVALLLATSLVTTGCSARAAGPAIGFGSAIAALGTAILVTREEPEPTTPGDPYPNLDGVGYAAATGLGLVVAMAGVALIAGGMIGLAESHEREAQAETAPLPDAGLDRVTLRAYTYAQAGDCAQVKAIGDRVRAADSDYFHTTFASDPLLAPCLR